MPPPRLSRTGSVFPPGANTEWGRSLTNIWCWNPHRHQIIIWTWGGIGWAAVCWSYYLWRTTRDWEISRVPLAFLAGAGAALHFGACVFTIYVWTKIRLFALLRVLLMNFQFLILFVLSTVWMSSSPRCVSAFVLLILLIVRGVLLRSYPAAAISLLAAGGLSALCVPEGTSEVAWHVGLGVVATGYALFLGLSEPEKGYATNVGNAVLHLAGLACLGTAIALEVGGDPNAGTVLGAALVGLCPVGVQAIGGHAHAAIFYNAAVAAGDLDIVTF